MAASLFKLNESENVLGGLLLMKGACPTMIYSGDGWLRPPPMMPKGSGWRPPSLFKPNGSENDLGGLLLMKGACSGSAGG